MSEVEDLSAPNFIVDISRTWALLFFSTYDDRKPVSAYVGFKNKQRHEK